MKHNTAYDRVLDKGEINSGEVIVETAGYVPAEKKILDMIRAGERLKRTRAEEFDFAEGQEVPDDFIDPTRSPNFDIADASIMTRGAEKRLDEQVESKKAEARKRAAEAAEKKKEAE